MRIALFSCAKRKRFAHSGRQPTALRACAAFVLLAGALTAGHARAQIVNEREPWRPPALTPTPACSVYSGSGTGNDPTFLVEMLLCTSKGEEVTGKVQYSGKSSGWSVRRLSGTWRDDRAVLVLREDAIVEQRPSPGWRFCTIDEYRLEARGSRALSGLYASEACHDKGTLELLLTQEALEEIAPRKDAAVPPSAVPKTLPGSKPGRASCSCRSPDAGDASDKDGGTSTLLAAALALVAKAARRLPLSRGA